ncbi:MAG: hypothetical protein WAL87_08920 [Chthoniobacterales bacterium]
MGDTSFLTSVDGAEAILVSYEPPGKEFGVPAADDESPLLVWLVAVFEATSPELAGMASVTVVFVMEADSEGATMPDTGGAVLFGSKAGAGTSPFLKRFDQSPEETGEVSGDVCAGCTGCAGGTVMGVAVETGAAVSAIVEGSVLKDDGAGLGAGFVSKRDSAATTGTEPLPIRRSPEAIAALVRRFTFMGKGISWVALR